MLNPIQRLHLVFQQLILIYKAVMGDTETIWNENIEALVKTLSRVLGHNRRQSEEILELKKQLKKHQENGHDQLRLYSIK